MLKKKVLVCGASGFIGRNMAETLARRDDFVVYGTYFKTPLTGDIGFEAIKADLTKEDDVFKVVKGMDIIIQAAATTSGAKDIVTKPYYHVTDNAVMNSLIFRSAYEHKVSHVVFFSCTVMYKSGSQPVRETDFNANENIFPAYFGVGWTKVYLEKMSEFYSRLGNNKYTVIRHSNIYGPYDKYDLERSHVFGATVTKVMTTPSGGKITVWGSGEEERDLLYSSDLVDFVGLALDEQQAPFELFNAGCGSSISIKDLVHKIITASAKDITVQHDLSKPTIKTKLCLDITKAKNIIGWQPQVSLDEGIRKTIQWYEKNYSKNDRRQ